MKDLNRYFNGELNGGEEKEFQRKIVERADSANLSDEMYEIFDRLRVEDDIMAERAFVHICSVLGLQKIKKISMRNVLIGIASSIAVFFIGAACALFHADRNRAEWTEIRVPYGSEKLFQLSDGSVLKLSPGTRITYPSEFEGRERRIFLDGELWADIESDKRHPFIIESGDISLQVLGTKFNFKSYISDSSSEICLVEGSVKLKIGSEEREKEILMNPGDAVSYNRQTGKIDIREAAPSLLKSVYKDDVIFFDNARLEDIVKELERVFNQKIVIADDGIREFRYYALFSNNESLEKILEDINIYNRLKIKKVNDIYYLTAR